MEMDLAKICIGEMVCWDVFNPLSLVGEGGGGGLFEGTWD